MKLVIHNTLDGCRAFYLEQKVGEKTYRFTRSVTQAELLRSAFSWRTVMYLNIRNARRWIRRCIEEDKK